jgi:DNA-binding transcriptional MerR regulator
MAPERSLNNYRAYNAQHSERLLFIRHCRALDMTLDEIRILLDFRDHPDGDCIGVNDVLDEHIRHVAERIASLTALEAQLRHLRGRCLVADTASSCAILDALGAESSCELVRAPQCRQGGGGASISKTGSGSD